MNFQIAGASRKGFERSDDDPTNELEHLTLACVLFNADCLNAVAPSLEPWHFANALHGELYDRARQRQQLSGDVPSISELLKAFEGTRDHEIAPTEFLLRLSSRSRHVASVAEAREASKGVIEASFRRERCGFIGKSAQEISEAVIDYQARCARLASSGNDNRLLSFFDSSIEVTAVSEYVVKGLIPAGSTCALHGPSGSGKTFIARDLSCCVASGEEFLGHRTTQGGVLYLCLEGKSDFPKRVKGVEVQTGSVPAGFAWLNSAYSISLASNPTNDACEHLIVSACEALARKTQMPTRLIVIDTLACAIAGDNENEAQAISALFARIDRIKAATGAAVLFIAHPGKDQSQGLRGSSALHAGLDAVIRIERDKDASERHVRLEKSKDGPEGPLFSFTLKTIVLGSDADGDEVTTCIVDQAEGANRSLRRRPHPGTGAAKALNELEHLLIETKPDPMKGHHRIPDGVLTVSKSAWRDACRQKGLSDTGEPDAERKAFQRALLALEKAGQTASYNEYAWIIGGTSDQRK
jgi:hypothetical protein